MWCPKCKTEYVTGITHCADCGIELVASLEDDALYDDDMLRADDALRTIPKASSHAYISKRDKKEDVKSTACTFTIVGIAGFVFLVLFVTGILPLNTAAYMKTMLCIVMGVMFAIFLFIGIRSFGQLKSLSGEADSEDDSFSEVAEWFRSVYSADDIDKELDVEQPEETLYFARYETMERLIVEEYPDLEDLFRDHIIETLYGELF